MEKWTPRKRVRRARAQFTPVSDDEWDYKPIKREAAPSVEIDKHRTKVEITTEEELKLQHAPLLPHIESPAALEKFKSAEIAPPDWQEYVRRIREMRRLRLAPVDEMGCYELPPSSITPPVARFQHLVTLMLSSQTKDETTSAAMQRLRTQLQPTLTPESVLALPEAELAALLLPVGFYRRKAGYIQKAAQTCLDLYGGDIPRKVSEMMQIVGVGPKMAHLLLQIAWGETEGIGVDVHVHRLSQWWGWVPTDAKPTPEKTRAALETWLPRELWAEINPLLVGFGQTWCPPRKSAVKCGECHLRDLCPARL